jgi:hypothetical protein
MIRNLMIGVTTAGLLVAVAGCSTSATPRCGYVGPDSAPGWKGQNFYSQNGGYVALNYTVSSAGSAQYLGSEGSEFLLAAESARRGRDCPADRVPLSSKNATGWWGSGKMPRPRASEIVRCDPAAARTRAPMDQGPLGSSSVAD